MEQTEAAIETKKKNTKEAAAIERLQQAHRDFETVVTDAVNISARNVGKVHTGRQRRSLMVFAKLIAHCMSMARLGSDIVERPDDTSVLVDHFSIAALARAAIDAALMTMYISEPSLSLTQWDFRRQLLFLHDANNRSRFLKPLRKIETIPFFETSDALRDGIKDKIKVLGATLLLSEVAISDYQKGFHIFVDGQRGAAREAGWDVDAFDFYQSYLSAYVHSHPVSFIRADEHDLKFGGISTFQADFLFSVYTGVTEFLVPVVQRMDSFSNPETGDPNGHLD